MKTTSTGRRFIKETSWGMYVWQTPDGEVLGDDEGRFMHVFCEEGNRAAIAALADAAKYYGHPEGKAVYWSGKRPISDEEYEHQVARQAAGLVPDPLDIGAIKDEMEGLKNERETRK